MLPDLAQTALLTFVDDEKAIEFGVKGSMYKCDLQAYTCDKTGPIAARPERIVAEKILRQMISTLKP